MMQARTMGNLLLGCGCIFWMPLALLATVLAVVPGLILVVTTAGLAFFLPGMLLRGRGSSIRAMGHSPQWWIRACGLAVVVAVSLSGFSPSQPLMGLVAHLQMADWCGHAISIADASSPNGRYVATVKHWGCAAGGALSVTGVFIRHSWDRFELYADRLAWDWRYMDATLDWIDDETLIIRTSTDWPDNLVAVWDGVQVNFVTAQ